MKPFWVLLVVAGCGGPEFTLAETASPIVGEDADVEAEPAFQSRGRVALPVLPGEDASATDATAVDAGLDAAADVASPDASTPDASQDASPDVAADAAAPDAAIDTGPACTTFHSSLEPTGPTCFGTLNAPTTYDEYTTMNGCSNQQTPVACRCRETYNCACLQAQGACGTRSWIRCDQALDAAPTVTCQ